MVQLRGSGRYDGTTKAPTAKIGQISWRRKNSAGFRHNFARRPPFAPASASTGTAVGRFRTAAQSETTSPVVVPQGVTYAADRFSATRRGHGVNRAHDALNTPP